MIFFAFPFMYYIFWKTIFEQMGMDFMFPIVDFPMNYAVMCTK